MSGEARRGAGVTIESGLQAMREAGAEGPRRDPQRIVRSFGKRVEPRAGRSVRVHLNRVEAVDVERSFGRRSEIQVG